MSGQDLVVLLIPLSGIAGALGLATWRDRGPSSTLARAANVAVIACWSVTLAAWIARWVEAGHIPIFGMWESALSLAAFTTLLAWVWDKRTGGELTASPIACLLATILLSQGIAYDRTPYALTISERSLVVDLHAIVAWLAFGVFAVNLAAAFRIVTKADSSSGWAGKALSSSLSLGFVFHSAMIATGSLYKFMLFGTVWTFDPIETMAFIVWIAYGTLLHLELMAGWDARRLAGWCIFVFVLLLASYRAIVYFPSWSTYHIFDIDLRLHLTGQELP